MSNSVWLARRRICSERRSRTYCSRGLRYGALRRLYHGHAEAVIRPGPTKEEIAGALGVAVAVNAGAALVYSARVMDAVKEYPRASSPQG